MSHVKVLLNVLHRSSPVIIELLSSEAEIKPHSNADPDSHSTTDPHTDPHSDIVSFDWPNGLSKGDHIQWTKEKLQAAMTVADVILHNGVMNVHVSKLTMHPHVHCMHSENL